LAPEIPEFLSQLKNYFEPEPPLLRSAKTIQIILLRETHDFAAFRTEAGDELNVVTLPRTKADPTPVIRVVMLASKQKAVENRLFAANLRTLAKDYGVKLDEKQEKCALKDSLCRKCPRCILFGAVSVEKGGERWNIKHRIEYSSAYSIEPYEDVAELLTWNAVSTATQSTGQALGVTENIQPVVHFPSVVTMISPTWEEFVMVMKTLIAAKSYGAETRIKGDVVNHVVGIIGGYEEVITSLDLLLELAETGLREDVHKSMEKILPKYEEYAAFGDKLTIIVGKRLEELVGNIQKFEISEEMVKRMYEQAAAFEEKAEAAAKKEKGT